MRRILKMDSEGPGGWAKKHTQSTQYYLKKHIHVQIFYLVFLCHTQFLSYCKENYTGFLKSDEDYGPINGSFLTNIFHPPSSFPSLIIILSPGCNIFTVISVVFSIAILNCDGSALILSQVL